jgi:GNAT superfamily N-acetyltransferase
LSCGVESLDTYLQTQASEDMRHRANAVFVLVPLDTPDRIAGFFTLCASALDQGDVPEAARRWIPRYPLVSATLLGRLAIAREYQGQGLSSVLLARALRKAYESAATVGSSMVVVDAIDDGAARFCEAHGFVRLPDSARLVLPISQIGRMVEGGRTVARARTPTAATMSSAGMATHRLNEP